MYSKYHSMYLKWTYFCNRHMGTISHCENCRQNSNRHSLHDSSAMSAITNYFYQIYENVNISCLLKSIVSIKYFESDFLEK